MQGRRNGQFWRPELDLRSAWWVVPPSLKGWFHFFTTWVFFCEVLAIVSIGYCAHQSHCSTPRFQSKMATKHVFILYCCSKIMNNGKTSQLHLRRVSLSDHVLTTSCPLITQINEREVAKDWLGLCLVSKAWHYPWTRHMYLLELQSGVHLAVDYADEKCLKTEPVNIAQLQLLLTVCDDLLL